MNFFEDNHLPVKHFVSLNYQLDHYEQGGFWCFEITIPKKYQEIFKVEKAFNIFSLNKEIVIENSDYYFVLESLTAQSLKEFAQLKPFYFRFHEGKPQQGKNKAKIINVLSCNPVN